MTLDPATQAISRFIGLFELIDEQGRLRQDYLQFKMKTAVEAEGEIIPGLAPRFIIGGQPEGYDPGLSYRPVAPRMKQAENLPEYHHSPVQVSVFHIPTGQPDGGSDRATSVSLPNKVADFADGPGSVVIATIQTAYLADDDLLLNGMNSDFVDVSDLQAALGRMESIADGLKGFDLSAAPQTSGWMDAVKGIMEQFDAPPSVRDAADGEGRAEIHAFRGEDAQGLIVNGSQAQEAPVWKDLLPTHLRPPADDKGETDGHDAENGDGDVPPSGLSASKGETIVHTSNGMAGDSQTSRPPEHDLSRDFSDKDNPEEPDGFEIVTGANSAINEIGVGSQWIDASVIVVQGDLIQATAISQVNMLVEHDSINGQSVTQQSAGFNIAEVMAQSSESEGGSDVEPSGWQLFRIEADLYQINWVQQFTFVTDFDRAEVTVSVQMTFLGLGENEIVNSAILNEFGYRFDLMFVSGNMIDATIISQTNVLYDSDEVLGGPIGMAAAGDSPAGMSLGDNLLYNKATITKTGIDTVTALNATFDAVADNLAAGRDTLAAELTGNKLLAGQEVLRALQIDGDLVKINLFEQKNVVGDADQLRLDMQSLRDDLGDQIKVVAGSNALINLATVMDYGVDSTIMVGGQVYQDALIHQAEWFDDDAPANGVKMAGLTNEAVAAFLSDDTTGLDGGPEAIAPTGSHDLGSNLDVMQAMLA